MRVESRSLGAGAHDCGAFRPSARGYLKIRSVNRGLALLLVLLAVGSLAVKVGNVEFVPSDLIFADAESKSRATADGSLPSDCKWSLLAETRLAKHQESQDCIRFYFKTTVRLSQECPRPNEQHVAKSCERVTATDPKCLGDQGRIASPSTDARVLSSGTTAEGRHQDVVQMADGTRITLVYDAENAIATVAFADGTADTLKIGK